MSRENVDVVRTLFETYSRGDYDAAAACLAPGVVYEVGQEVPAFGPDEVRAMWERWDGAWEDMATVPEEYLKRPGQDEYRPMALDVIRIEEGRVAEIVTFPPAVIPSFGPPAKL